MHHKIRKAVFPVAGLGTRFLPATKAMPKELLPIIDKPIIQYAVEEAIEAGVTELVFVTGRAIEDHFDAMPELERELRESVMEEIIKLVLPSEWLTSDTQFHINSTGNFVIGGPVGDCGLTARKNIVDTYGGMARHGGGAFSGKNLSKVDRSAAYAGRYVAKNIVASGLAERCEIQISYAIGVSEPTSISINTFGTGKLTDTEIALLVREHFDLTAGGLIKMLDLKRSIYQQTAAYGHLDRELPDSTWEKTDKADVLRKAL